MPSDTPVDTQASPPIGTTTNAATNMGYAKHAQQLFQQYEALSFENIHAEVMAFIPRSPVNVLDIGAGSGRDAVYLAALGHRVTAVEPTTEFLQLARQKHAASKVEWLADCLPDLAQLRASQPRCFDFVLINAVWMHLDPQARREGMATLAKLCAPNARVVMSLRHGPVPQGRRMHEVSGDETSALAQEFGFDTEFCERSESKQPQNRAAGVQWTKIVLRKNS